MPLRAPRDEFTERVWDFWSAQRWSDLYQYMFSGYGLTIPNTVDPLGGGGGGGNQFTDAEHTELTQWLDDVVLGSDGSTQLPQLDVIHTATEADDHAIEIDVDAAGFGDVKALDIDYVTGAIAAGEDEGIILININEIAATGGDVFGLEVLATDGSAGIYGMKAGALVGPIHQDSGVFANPTTGTDNTPSTDVAAMIDGNIATTTAIFEADNEYIIIGAAAAFEEIEFILTTDASVSIKPTFWYSTTGTAQFTQFTPVDGTNGFKNTGVVAWDASDLTGHVADDVTTTFDIKVIRTRNNLTTSPVLGYAKAAATTEYIWDKTGDIKGKDLYALGGSVYLDTDVDLHDGGAGQLDLGADGSHNSVFRLNSAAAGKYGRLVATDTFIVRTTGTAYILHLLADAGYVRLTSGIGYDQRFDCGDLFYFRDRDDSYAIRLTINSDAASPGDIVPYVDVATDGGDTTHRFQDWHADQIFATQAGPEDDADLLVLASGILTVNGRQVITNTAVDTAAGHSGLYLTHTKTAGATDHDDIFYGIRNLTTYNQSGGEISHLRGAYSVTKLTDGSVGDGVNTRQADGLWSTLDLDGGTVTGDARGAYISVDQDGGTISGDAFGAYITADFDSTVSGTSYMLYLAEGDGINYGIYQSGAAPNVLGGDLYQPDDKKHYFGGAVGGADAYIEWDSAPGELDINAGAAAVTVTAAAIKPATVGGVTLGTTALEFGHFYQSDNQYHYFGNSQDARLGYHLTRYALESVNAGSTGYIPRILHSQTSDTTQSGTTEVVVSTFTIPGSSWAAGKVYHFSASGTLTIPGGDTVTVAVKIGGISGTTLLTNLCASAAGEWRLSGELVCRTRGASTTIAWGASMVTKGISVDAESDTVGSFDTTANQDLVVTHDSSHAGGATTIQTFNVWES